MGFVVSLIDAVFRRRFTSAGLLPRTAAIDDDTTLHFWAHPSLLLPSSNGDASSVRLGQDQSFEIARLFPTSSTSSSKLQRPVVVLIHGFGPGPTWQWAAQVGPLSRHFDLVVPTLLFFGASTTRAPARSDAFQAAAVAKLLTGGKHLRVAGEVHVVGTSYGGLVAYHLARALGGDGECRAGKVVLCDADAAKGADDNRALAAKGGVAEVAELLSPADSKALRRLMELTVHTQTMTTHIPEWLIRDVHRKHCRADRRDDIVQLVKGIVTGEGFQLAPLAQEVLIIWGEFDQIFPVEKAHVVKERLGEKATVKIIPNTGHQPQQEDPKLFNDILLSFLMPHAAALLQNRDNVH